MVVDITEAVVCVREMMRGGEIGYGIGVLEEEVSRYYPQGKVVVFRNGKEGYDIGTPVCLEGALRSLDGDLIGMEMLVENVSKNYVRMIEQEIRV